MTGQLYAAFQGEDKVEIASTIVVLNQDASAKLYRRAQYGALLEGQTLFSNQADYTSFSGAWSYDDEAEVVSVSSLQFSDSTEIVAFEGISNLGMTGVIVSDQSSGVNSQADAELKQAIKFWDVKHNCSLPAASDANNLGSAQAN